jgi:sugar lactone lactonase YvrE
MASLFILAKKSRLALFSFGAAFPARISKRGAVALAALLVAQLAAFQNCSSVNFGTSSSPGSPAAASSTALAANNIALATNVNVPLAIQASQILAANSAPAGQALSLTSVGAPSLGQLTQSGAQYNFVSSTLGSAQFAYSISDTKGDSATGTITVKVLAANSATGSFYACNLQAMLYVLDPFTGRLQSLVTTTFNGSALGLNDLAIDASGILYGKDPGNNIYKVDATTGAATLYLASLLPATEIAAGLTFLPNGNLATAAVTSSGVSVVSTNITTKAQAVLVPQSAGYLMTQPNSPGGGITVSGDIKALPDGYLYWTVSDLSTSLCASYTGGGWQALVRVDPNSGATSEIACLSQPDVYGLGFAQKSLYGFSGGGNLVEISLTSGAVALINATGDTFVGAASNPALW